MNFKILQNGFRNIDLKFIILKLFYPVTVCIGCSLAVPCIFSRSLAPLISKASFKKKIQRLMNMGFKKYFFQVENEAYLLLIERRIYPVSLFMFLLVVLFIFQMRQFRRMYERIRNDKYLVGQRLINFERKEQSAENKSH